MVRKSHKISRNKSTYTVFLSPFISLPLNSDITSRKLKLGGGPSGLLGSCSGFREKSMPSLQVNDAKKSLSNVHVLKLLHITVLLINISKVGEDQLSKLKLMKSFR